MRRSSQSGYVLLVVLIAMTIAAVAAAAAVPYIKTQIQRQREQELIHDGNEYVKAIQKYFHKFGRYPNSIDQLENTNHMRFLRKRFKDPITGQDDWRVIHIGEAKFPPKLTMPGAQSPGQQIGQQIGQPVGTAFGGGATGQGAQQNGAGANPQPVGGVGFSLGGSSGSTSGGTFGASSFGGAPIIGVAIPSKAKSLIVYNEREHYDEWEFIYDPRIEALKRAAQGGNGNIALPANGSGTGSGMPNNAPGANPGFGPGANTGGGMAPMGPK